MVKFFLLITFSWTFFNQMTLAQAPSQGDCLKCHGKDQDLHLFSQSSHKNLLCTACHQSTGSSHSSSTSKKQCVSNFTTADCSSCHKQEHQEYLSSVHNSPRLPISCDRCHSNIHSIETHKYDKLAIADQCVTCHSRQEDYFQSAHHEALKKGQSDAATCTDCHGKHNIQKVDEGPLGQAFHTKACLSCHSDKEMMKKNKLSTVLAETYFKSFHGKNVRLGYPEGVAGCADCHTGHRPLSAKNPLSSIHKNQIVQTCTKCHEGASANFALFVAHGDDEDSEKYPGMYWTRSLMTGLLVGTFLFFWVHTLLWANRARYENRERQRAIEAAIAEGRPLSRPVVPSEAGRKKYYRFKLHHILLHLMVVVSFLTLAMTGLPLKFSATSWGKSLVDFFGGVEQARLLHHTAAGVTFLYFAISIIMSIRFLFFDNSTKAPWLTRLLGPDSLFPNQRDWSDMKAMFAWFFFKGPKPSFDRWTYWEKFDFLAVFWGMFAIGLSGLLLWFPEFFGRLVPGWVFNIATIVHSDEALLATGFIFTVHFFNTHFRPEKFPMDMVIFNGEMSSEEFQLERKDQWDRLTKQGQLDSLKVLTPRSKLWNLTFRIFGTLAVLLGLLLALGILIALIF